MDRVLHFVLALAVVAVLALLVSSDRKKIRIRYDSTSLVERLSILHTILNITFLLTLFLLLESTESIASLMIFCP
ncbi:hypothetical protein MJL48_33345, partial [Salmonella enterica subsp. enterica serovar Kentucky]|nr:hypothetical protein [Salmonella enterica subsp. enterica serovar Kentucky]